MKESILEQNNEAGKEDKILTVAFSNPFPISFLPFVVRHTKGDLHVISIF